MATVFDFQYLITLISDFFNAWQVKTTIGLISIDVVLGLAAALRAGRFDFGKLAVFYKSNVLPYVLGYLVFYVAVGYIIPPGSLGELGVPVNAATVTLAWSALAGTLLKSILGNFNLLYKAE
jgi:hypothetical protein